MIELREAANFEAGKLEGKHYLIKQESNVSRTYFAGSVNEKTHVHFIERSKLECR